MQEEKLGKVRKILELIDTNVTQEEFLKSFKAVLDFVKEIKEQNKKELGLIKYEINDAFSEAKKELTENNNAEFGKIRALLEELALKVYKRLSEVKDGQDADEEKILENLKAQIKIPTIEELSTELPKLGERIRDALELLQKDERLDKSAIKGLEEELKRIEEIKGRLGGGGGFSYMAMDMHFLDCYEPTGAINGVNTDFVLSHAPNPAASLKVYLDGQKMKLTTDYTLSNRTITFLTAPLTGSYVEAEHRI